jgi:tetratricopeptide (TPR) repeat protein
MSAFESLLNTVWQVARSEEDFLTTFARLRCDRQRAEKILALPQLQDFCVTDYFSGKCETRAEALRLLGDRCYLATAASTSDSADVKPALQLYTSAIKLAPHGSRSLAHSYYGRSQVLLRLGYTNLALEDAERALRLNLPQQDAIKLLVLIAICHQQNHAWVQAEELLHEALDKLRKSDLENNIKATMTGEIIGQLKTINGSKKEDKSKVRLQFRFKCLTYGPVKFMICLKNPYLILQTTVVKYLFFASCCVEAL